MCIEEFYKKLVDGEFKGRRGGIYLKHKASEDKSVYFLSSSGQILCYSKEAGTVSKCSFAEFTSKDLELYNPQQYVRTGYFVIPDVYKAPFVIGALLQQRLDMQPIITSLGLEGACHFDTVNAKFQTVRLFCAENMTRKANNIYCLPFIKDIAENSIHVSFSCNLWRMSFDEARSMSSQELSKWILYMESMDVPVKWVQCKMDRPSIC